MGDNMRKSYYDMIDHVTPKGWEIEIVFKKNKVEGCVCHASWKSNDIGKVVSLPTFIGADLNEVMKKIYHYFYAKVE